MDKNKLGIVINTTKTNNRTSGFRPIYNYNSDEWSSIVRDTGAELKKVTNNSHSDPIHLIQFVSNGCCYCIMKSITGRKDYQSAWIFIHKDIILQKGELISVIKKIDDILSLDVEDRKVELDDLFSKTYPTSESPCYRASSGDTYAVRYYGHGTNLLYTENYVLDEDYLYQSDYCKYKSVFLVNKAKGQVVTDATDLSDIKLQKSIVIELPKEKDGFKPYIEDTIITNAVRVTEGKVIAVKWKRFGYAPIDKQGKSTEELLIKESEYWKSFSYSLFRTIDKVTKKDIGATIRFTGLKRFDDNENPRFVFFKEEDLNRISFCVEKATYHSLSGVIDLTKPNENGEYVIELQPEEHIYNCCISTNIPDNRKIEFVIKTQYKLRGNEIPGFKFDGGPSETRENKLKAAPQHNVPYPAGGGQTPKPSKPEPAYSGDRYCRPSKNPKKRSWIKYAFIALLGLCLLGGCYALYNILFHRESENSYVLQQPEQYQTEWDRALEYLSENNAYWTKSEMETYSELKSVYAMIKDFQFNELKSFIELHPDLKILDSWNRLYEITKKYNNKKGSFQADDDRIEIEKYLKTDFSSKEDVLSHSSGSNSSATSGSSSHELKGEVRKTTPANSSNRTGRSGSNNNTNSQDQLN